MLELGSIWFVPERGSAEWSVGLALAAIVLLLIARRCGDRLPAESDGPLLLAAFGPLCTCAVGGLAVLCSFVPLIAFPLLALVAFVCGPIALICTLVSPCLPPLPHRAAVHWLARLVSAASVLSWFWLR